MWQILIKVLSQEPFQNLKTLIFKGMRESKRLRITHSFFLDFYSYD